MASTLPVPLLVNLLVLVVIISSVAVIKAQDPGSMGATCVDTTNCTSGLWCKNGTCKGSGNGTTAAWGMTTTNAWGKTTQAWGKTTDDEGGDTWMATTMMMDTTTDSGSEALIGPVFTLLFCLLLVLTLLQES